MPSSSLSRPFRRAAAAASVGLLCAAGAAASPASSAPLRSADALRVAPHRGGDPVLVTRGGRRVLLRGINVVAHVDYAGRRATLPVGSADGRQFRALGLNAVRIAVSWSKIAPAPGTIDQRYLDRALRTARHFSRRGAYVLLDLHQDRYAAGLGHLGQEGDGAPRWAVDTAGIPCDEATTRRLGIHPYYISACATAAAARFFANAPVAGRGLHDWYADAVAAVSRTFLRLGPAFAGIELYNEPANPGTPAQAGLFVTRGLWPLYRTVIGRVRATGYRGPLWLDPQSAGEQGDRAALRARFGGDRQLVLVVHPYVDVFDRRPNAGTPRRIRSAYRALVRQGRRHGTAVATTETPGASGGVWDAYGRRQLDAQDAAGIPGFVWLWKQPASAAYQWEVLRADGGLPAPQVPPVVGRPRLVSSDRRVLSTRATARTLRVVTDGRAGVVTVWTGTASGGRARRGAAPRVTIDGRPGRGAARPRAAVQVVRAGGGRYGGREVRVRVPSGRHTLRLAR